MLVRLARKMPLEQLELFLDELGGERHEDVRTPKIAVDLRDLVFQDQVIAERVPGQLAGKAVILMEVVAGVSEDDLRVDAPLEPLEDLLDLPADIRQKAVPELMDLDTRDSGVLQEGSCARTRLVLAGAGRGEHDPIDF